MTENSWPRDESLNPPIAGQVPNPPVSPFPPTETLGVPAEPSQDDGSASETAKKEAAHVAHEATEAVQNVTGTTKAEVAHVADEVKINARDLFHRAKSDLTDQAGTQQQKVAEGLRSVSSELESMASSSDQPGMATDLVRQAAERSSAVASWLEGRDPGSLLADVKSFARRKPGMFLLLAAGAGMMAGRLTRSLNAGAPDQDVRPATGTALPVSTGPMVPSVPEELPETTAGSLPGTYPADPPVSEPLTGTGRADFWLDEPVVTDPLPPVSDDALGQDPFDGGRR